MPLRLPFLPLTTCLAMLPLQAAACRLALVLAMDVSSSVDAAEDGLQRIGLATALTSPEVVDALLAIPDLPVALRVFEWSGRNQQADVLGWTLLSDAASIRAAAAAIAGSTRSHADFPTALGHALGHAVVQFRTAPRCMRHVIDLSGDGMNNAGYTPADAYRHFPFAEVTVNALAIGGASAGLSEYYRREVLHGPGAFLVEAAGYGDFERAMRMKLEREARPPQVGALAGRGAAAGP